MKSNITIVGPRSDDNSGGELPGKNSEGNGVNGILIMAASDPQFRKRLLNEREELLAELREKLSEEEVEMLREIPHRQLKRMIDSQRMDKDIKSQIATAIKRVGIAVALAAIAYYLYENRQELNDFTLDWFFRYTMGHRPDGF